MLGHNLVLKQAADSLPSHIDGSAGLILQSGFLNLFLASGRGMLTGWKIVEGRSIRKITDTDSVADALTKSGYTQSDIYKPIEMRTITELEKLVGKKQFAALCGEWVNKPQGKPTLAPESDKRKAIDPIADDFKSINID